MQAMKQKLEKMEVLRNVEVVMVDVNREKTLAGDKRRVDGQVQRRDGN